MARKLEAQLDLNTRQAVAKTRQATRELEKLGRTGDQAGKQTTQGMNSGAAATDGMTRKVVALGASYLGLGKLLQTITTIVDKYNQAITLRDQFAAGAVGMQRSVAPAASQFGVQEDVMARFVGQLGVDIGAGPGGVSGISAMLTGAASAGLISPTVGPQGQFQMGAQDRAKMVSLGTFAEMTGATGVGGDLSKLVRKGMGADLSPTNQLRVMRQMQQAYRQSQLSDWGEFITGAVSGTSRMLEQGIGFERALSGYASLAKMSKSGQQAGELWRLIYEQTVAADRPEVVEWYGADKYWREREEDPGALMGNILDRLTGLRGPQKAKTYKRLGITPELGGRISALGGSRVERESITRAMRGATAGDMARELAGFRGGQRATQQAAATSAELLKVAEGTGKGAGQAASARAVADAMRTILRARDPAGQWASEVMQMEEGELETAMTRLILDNLKSQGAEVPTQRFASTAAGGVQAAGEFGVDITSDGVTFKGGNAAARRELQRVMGQGQVNIGTYYGTPPVNREQNNATRTEGN